MTLLLLTFLVAILNVATLLFALRVWRRDRILYAGLINALTTLFFLNGSIVMLYIQGSKHLFFNLSEYFSNYYLFLSLSIINLIVLIFYNSRYASFRLDKQGLITPPSFSLIFIALLVASYIIGFFQLISLIDSYGISELLNPSNRSEVRHSSSMYTLIFGYLIPLLSVYGYTVKRKMSLIPLFGITTSLTACLLLGFRGLLLSILVLQLFAYIQVNRRISVKTFIKSLSLVIIVIYFATIGRSEASRSIIEALINRIFSTVFYQIDNARTLYESQGYPGEWLINEFLIRVGFDVPILEKEVWRIDFQDSEFVGGSYPYIGDLLGNFGEMWVGAYMLLVISVYMIDKRLMPKISKYVKCIDFAYIVFAFVIFRISMFNLSAGIVPLFLGVILVALSLKLRIR
jgi:hypothetical protein